MFKILRPIKDTYITNRVINGEPQVSANVGGGGSLDMFKLYGITASVSGTTKVPNTELSRLLIKFDLEPLRKLVAAGTVDPSNPSFSCKLHLHDVYGGQPTPSNFSVNVHPLSASFDEGPGRDVVFYSDYALCNWLTASSNSTWYVSGCGLRGDDSVPSDYLSASQGVTLQASQAFVTGEEDLDVDVTAAVSATLAGLIPDAGFRIAFDPTLESDQHTYFVKRFASRHAYNGDLHPKLFVRFDSSIQDDTTTATLDEASNLFLHNYVRSAPANLISGSTPVTGNNCLILQLITPVSGDTYSLYFTGSQHSSGLNAQTGIYSASVLVSTTDVNLSTQWQTSGSLTFTPIWKSLDGTVPFLTGSKIKFQLPQRGAAALTPRYDVTVLGLRDRLATNEQVVLRINIFDRTAPSVVASRIPVQTPGLVVRDVHYQVRDAVTKLVVIPFDSDKNSTRASSDSAGMYFHLDTSNLTPGRNYVVDVLIMAGGYQQLYQSASPAFRVGDTT